MKLNEIPRECAACKKPLRFPFFRVRIDYVLGNQQAADQVLGLARMYGGSQQALALAEVMAPTPEVAKCAGDEEPAMVTTAYLCVACVCLTEPLAAAWEAGNAPDAIAAREAGKGGGT